MRSRFMIVALVGAVGALGVAAKPSAGAPDPCLVLTPAQVGAALGVAVNEGRPIGPKSCTWTESVVTTGKRAVLTFLTVEAFAAGKTPLEGTEKPAVSGVGDEAYYKYFAPPRYDKIKLLDLDVKKGSTAFDVKVGGFPLDDAKGRAKALAVAAVAKL